MENLVSCESIMGWFQNQVEQKIPIPPSLWVDGSAKLNVLIADEHEKLFNLEHSLSMVEKDLLEKDFTSSKARVYIKAMEAYKDMQIQKAKIKQIEEFIRLGKIRARMSEAEFRGY